MVDDTVRTHNAKGRIVIKLRKSKAAQALFVIYISDSIVLRLILSHFRECMKMVRKSQ